MRWLHTYVSMLGFLAVVFFGITGLTLNHAAWFESGAESTREEKGTLDAAWLGQADDSVADRLAVVEHLRRVHGIAGTVCEFQVAADECVIVFKGPGYTADAVVDREHATYELTETRKGAFALIDDLHKGRDTGPVWSWVVDVSAVVVTVSGLTGLWLLCYLKKRRLAGMLVATLGAAVPVALWWLFVP
ncbi:MAG: PepSY-associated TM helix domain-containing protein [Planctomycetota bacterium]